MKLEFEANGKAVSLDVPPMKRLLDVLREDAGLTGTKEGCGEGECGACSILVDGELVNACLVPACQAEGRKLTTVEGMLEDEEMTPVQEAFIEFGGTQCGICTPGMLLAAQVYVESGKEVTREGVREALAGNLCRCTGYQKIVDAVIHAAEVLGKRRDESQQGGRMTRVSEMEVRRPATLDDALAILADEPGQWRPIAGGTDMMVWIEMGVERPARVLDIWPLADALRFIREEDGHLVMGALATYTDVIESPLVQANCPSLVHASREVGAMAIQNRGTLGGNLANASPAADTVPVLMAMGSEVVLAGKGGQRSVALEGLLPGLQGHRPEARRADPQRAHAPSPGGRAGVVAQGRHAPGPEHQQGDDGGPGDGGRHHREGAAGGRKRGTHVRSVEEHGGRDHRQGPLTPELIQAARDAVKTDIAPISDIRSSAEYRNRVAENLVARWLGSF